MKRFIFSALAVLMTSMLIVSCGQENLLEENEAKREVLNDVKAQNTVDPTNDNNAMDSYGVKHNQQIIEVFSNGLSQQSSVADFYNYFNIPSQQRDFLDEVRPYFQLDESEYGGLLKKAQKDHPVIFEYSAAIRAIMNSKHSLAEKVAKIKQYENDFDYKRVSKNQAKILQLSSSIARHSLCLWAPVADGGQGYYDIINDDPDFAINWYEVGAEDFLSACWGAFFTGNPLVALAGGVVSSAISLAI